MYFTGCGVVIHSLTAGGEAMSEIFLLSEYQIERIGPYLHWHMVYACGRPTSSEPDRLRDPQWASVGSDSESI